MTVTVYVCIYWLCDLVNETVNACVYFLFCVCEFINAQVLSWCNFLSINNTTKNQHVVPVLLEDKCKKWVMVLSTRLEYARWRKDWWNGFLCCTTFSIVLVSMYLNKYCRKCWSKKLIKLFFFLSPLMYKDLYLEKFLLLKNTKRRWGRVRVLFVYHGAETLFKFHRCIFDCCFIIFFRI